MSNTPKNPKQLLLDIGKDLNITEGISEIFDIFGRKWKMSLLNEEESNWRMAHVVTSSKLSAVTSFRLPTLAIGIREIEGVSVYDFFAEDWDKLTPDSRQELLSMNPYAKKYFCAEHLMQFLSDKYPEGIAELWEHWQQLEKRRNEAIAALKKSSGESSEKTAEPNTTEPSPTGEEK
jgi:hypothetical protein